LALYSLINAQTTPSTSAITVVTPPTIPGSFPAVDQAVLISGTFLQDPIVVNAMKIVTTVVPANILAIPPSTYISGSTVTYNSDAAANCYWPTTQCQRASAGTWGKVDIFTCPGTGLWGMTYDDGPTSSIAPDSDTSAIRTQLNSMNMTATFFVVGSSILTNPNQLQLHVSAGHQIGSHTWTHHPLTSLSNEQIVAEIKYTEAVIFREINKVPAFLRPPYGDVDDRVRAIASALGYQMTFWNLDSNDANVSNSAENATAVATTITGWVVRTGSPSMISLQHDINAFTSGISVNVLKELKTTGLGGYKVVTIAQCVKSEAYQMLTTDVKNVTSSRSSTTTMSKTSISVGASVGSSPFFAASGTVKSRECGVFIFVVVAILISL
ncbi:chitin deacetylase, partial [Nowakowskiella sp. JEL0078]